RRLCELLVSRDVGSRKRWFVAHQICDNLVFGLVRCALNVLLATQSSVLRIFDVIFLLVSRLLDQRLLQLLRNLREQRVTALRRFKLSDGARGIESAHSGVLPGAKRKRAAALFLQRLLGRDKSPRNRVVDCGMQGVDAAGEQLVVRVKGDM